MKIKAVAYPLALVALIIVGFLSVSTMHPAYQVRQNSTQAMESCGQEQVSWVDVDGYGCKEP